MKSIEYQAANHEKVLVRGRARCRDRNRKLNLLKMGRPCYDCGGMFPPEAMDWDHIPGKEKKFDIGAGRTRKLDVIFEEINKCQLVCANCHRVRTKARLGENLK